MREILCEYEHLRSSLKGSGYLMACKCCAYCYGLQRLSADRGRFLLMMFKETLFVNGNESFYSTISQRWTSPALCYLRVPMTFSSYTRTYCFFYIYYYSGLQSFLFTYKDLTPGRMLSIQLHTRMHAHRCTHARLSKQRTREK